MANHLPRKGRLQPKTVARLCNQLLAGSGWIVRDWQRDSLLDLVPMNERFTLETLDGHDWTEIPDIYIFHAELLAKHGPEAATP